MAYPSKALVPPARQTAVAYLESAAGRRASITDPSGATTWLYDDRKRRWGGEYLQRELTVTTHRSPGVVIRIEQFR